MLSINAWMKLVTDTGVPLAILAIGGYFFIKISREYIDHQKVKDEQNRLFMVERVEKSEKRQEELVEIARELSETNRTFSERLTSEIGELKDEVNGVSGKIDILVVKVDSQLK